MSIYEMKLGDLCKLTYAEVLRVPGGWIFHWGNASSQVATFVPFNNEFQAVKEAGEGGE